MSDTAWVEIAKEIGSDKFSDDYAWRYFDFYERELRGFEPRRIVEIGVQKGLSLKFWKRVFPKAEIVGVDIDPRAQVDGFKVVTADQSADGAFDWLDWADMVIDDGGHTMRQQVRTWKALWPKLSVGGVYVVEDLHTNWMAGYGDKQYPLGASMAMVKMWTEMVQPLSGKPRVGAVSVYPSIAFAWKGKP